MPVKLFAYYQTDAHRESAGDWRENYLGDSLFYSCRDTVYDRASYPSTLHYHDYYELVVFLEGSIRYICESETFSPAPGDIILVPPGRLHMSMLEGSEATRYRRHVFYLYPDAFAAWNGQALTDFLAVDRGMHLTLPQNEREALFALLDRLDTALAAPNDSRERALAIGLAMQIFYHIGSAHPHTEHGESTLPPAVTEIRAYLDAHFTEIASVTEAADRLYYSREYIARLFRIYFNTTVSDYIRTRRVAYSRTLIAEGLPLSEACFRAGFGNLSTFIRAFRTVTGMTPSQYRGSLGDQNA